MFGGRSARYFSLSVGGEEGWRAKSQGRASESAKRSLVEMAEALLFPSLFREERGGRAGGSDSDSDDGEQKVSKIKWKGQAADKNNQASSLSSRGHRDGGEGRVRMARVENATAPLPYSAISGTGGSAGGAHSCWRGSGSVECCPLPAARCPRMRMRMQWEEPCCKTGPRPAKTRGWQPAAGLRAHGTNQLHSFFAERNSCPSDREQARNSEFWAAMPLPGLIFPRR